MNCGLHQTLGNIICSFELQDNYLDQDDPWKGVLSVVTYAICATYHTTTQKTPGQLVFGRDMVFNIQHTANWEYIRKRKQDLIDQNNQQENQKRIEYEYNVGDKILLRTGIENKHKQPYSNPHTVLQVHSNGTLRIEKGVVAETVNIPNRDKMHNIPSSSFILKETKNKEIRTNSELRDCKIRLNLDQTRTTKT